MLYLVKLGKARVTLGKYPDNEIDLATSIGKGIAKHTGDTLGIMMVGGGKPRLVRKIKRSRLSHKVKVD